MLFLIGAFAGAGTLWRPVWGVALYYATLPALRYFAAAYALQQSPATFPGLMVGLAVLIRVLIRDGGSRRKVGLLLGLVTIFVISSAAHFGTLVLHHPGVLTENLFNADQLNPFVFVSEGVLWLAAGLLFLSVGHLGQSGRARRLFFGALVAQGIVFVMVVGVDAVINGKAIPVFWMQNSSLNIPGLYAIFGEHNTFGVFCLLHAVLAIGLILSPSVYAKALGVVLLVTYGVMLVFSFSLSSLLAGVLAGILAGFGVLVRNFRRGSFRYYGLSRTSRRAFVIGIVLLASTLTAAYVMLEPGPVQERIDRRFRELLPRNLLESVEERRMAPWLAAAAMVRDYPVFGIGLGRYYAEFKDYREVVPENDRGYLFRVAEHENAHSYFLQLAAECGLVGLMLLLWGLFFLVKRCRWSDSRSAAVGLSLVAVSIASLLQHPLLVELVFITVSGLAGLCFASGGQVSHPSSPGFIWWKKWLLVAGIVLIPVHSFSAWNDYPPDFQYGLYPTERSSDGDFNWTSGLAFVHRPWPPDPVLLRFLSVDPGIDASPATVVVELNGRPAAEVTLEREEWKELRLKIPPGTVLGLVPSRIFQVPGDPRRLGVAVQFRPG